MKSAMIYFPLNEALVGSSRISVDDRHCLPEAGSFPKEKTERKVDSSPPETLRVANP